jgi:hypothetical protein
MKRFLLIFSVSVSLLALSCSKADNLNSGTVYIDNKLYGSTAYYSRGFSFSKAKIVSTQSNPGPDITIEAGSLTQGGSVQAFLASDNFNASFYLAGQYPTAELAEGAFKSFTSVESNLTWTSFGSPLYENQIWLFRTNDENYAKLLIISDSLNTTLDPDFASCTFKWVYQPDGSTTFPE